MARMRRTSVAVLLAAGAVARVWAGGEGAVDLGDLVANLARAEALHASLETTLTITAMASRPLEAGSLPWEDDARVFAHHLKWVMHEGRLRLEWTEEAFGAPGQQPLRSIGTWDGETWAVRVPARNKVDLLRHPPRGVTLDCLAFFNLAPWSSFADLIPLSRLLRIAAEGGGSELGTVKLLDTAAEGSVCSYTFAIGPSATTLLGLVVDAGPPWRLLSVSLEAFMPGADGTSRGDRRFRTVYHVAEWSDYGGLFLPKRAYRDSYSYRRGTMGRVVLERHDARDLSPDPPSADIFRVGELKRGTKVLDNRLGLTYEIGSWSVYIDGIPHDTTEPVGQDLPTRLPYILDSVGPAGRTTDALRGDGTDRAVEDRFDPSVRWTTVLGVLGFCATLVTLPVIRWARRKAGRPPADRPVWARALLIAVAGGAGGAAIGFLVSPSGSTTGSSESVFGGGVTHEFRPTVFTGRSVDLTHRFTLVNQHDQDIQIKEVKSSCSCTVAHLSRRTLGPGEHLEIDITLTLSRPGRRVERVWLDCGDTGVQVLTVSGTARRTQSWAAAQHSVRLSAEDRAQIVLTAIGDGELPPAAPELAAPIGATAVFEEWVQLYVADETSGRPSRWHGLVQVRQEQRDPLALRTSLVIRFEDSSEQVVDLTGWPRR